jgi:ubiquinone/menaquinone biosynthesis C-methylase UbiE
VTNKRTHKVERLARIYDEEILPVWGNRFGKMLLRGINVPERGQVLDVACGTGFAAAEVVRRMPANARLIAIDGSSAMLDVARKKLAELSVAIGKRSVFFRTESAEPRLSFADDVYDLVLCNLGLAEMPSMSVALRDFARVAKKGGEVRCSLALDGTFQEFYDIYREVLIKHDKHEALDRLNHHLTGYPTGEDGAAWLEAAGLDAHVEVEEFSLLFRSSREFFFAPVIEYGPLPEWKAIAGKGQELQDVFWYIKEAIDAYFGGRAFEVTVKAGCLIGRKCDPAEDVLTGRMARMPAFDDDEDTGHGEAPTPAPMPAAAAAKAAAAAARDRSVRTSEIDIVEIQELQLGTDDYESMDDDEDVDAEIDAFVEGRQRPQHLDED